MRLPYAVKAFAAQFFCVVLVAPLILYWGGNSLFPILGGQQREPWNASVFVLLLGLAAGGFFFARKAKLPGIFAWRQLPVLLFPLLLVLLWANNYMDSAGNYSTEFPVWAGLRWLTLPPHYLVWVIMSAGDAPHPYLQSAAVALGLLSPEDIESGVELYYLLYFDLFSTWHTLGLPLFMHAAWLAGFEIGAWNKTDATLMPAKAHRGRIVIPAVCIAAVVFLLWQISIVENSIMGSFYSWDAEADAKVLRSEYSNEKATFALDAPSSLRISSNHPRMDGATAFYPVYASAFKAIYVQSPLPAGADKDFASQQEIAFQRLLQCSTTRKAYSALTAKEVDVIFAFEPSAEQLREAKERGVTLRLIPIGQEAFVFLTHTDNPVSTLTREQIRGIYTRRIDNWKELGGANARILPFQRPQNSGSQTIMEHMVMEGKPLTEPLREEFLYEMGGVMVRLADYRNEAASIGYSFRRYALGQKMKDLKFLAVDGVDPSPEHVADGTYPFIARFYAVVRDEDSTPELKALLDWFTGPEGQALVQKAGYVPMPRP